MIFVTKIFMQERQEYTRGGGGMKVEPDVYAFGGYHGEAIV